MRTIDRSAGFVRDYKREAKGRHRSTLGADLVRVLSLLADGEALEPPPLRS
jgi:mRNA interferase YafQ